MPRNRLEELQRNAKHAPITQEEEMAPLNKKKKNNNNKKKKENDLEMEERDDPESFLERIEETVAGIDRVEKNAVELRSIQKSILNSTHKDEVKEDRMKDLMEEQKKLAKKIRAILASEQKWIEDHKEVEVRRKMTSKQLNAYTMRRTQVESNSRRFYDVWAIYNQDQVDYRDRTKRMFIKRCKITNADYSDDQIEEMLDEGQTQVFAASILDQTRLARQQLTELQDRHDQFIKLEASIREVRDMFMEVQQLVAQQGEMVDNIASVVQRAELDVEAGRGHLQEAKKKQRAARKKKLICGSILAVILLIVILVILGKFI